MKTKKIVPILVFLGIALASCAVPQQAALPQAPETAIVHPTATVTSEPTAVSATSEPTEEPLTPFTYQFITMDMIDDENGTAILMDADNVQYLVSTIDGGKSWNDITPIENEYILSASFLVNGSGMLTTFNEDGNSKLWTTTNGGKTWASNDLSMGMAGARIELFTDELAIARVSEGGAGTAYTHFYETTDQGQTWSLVPLIAPQPEENLGEGVIPLCNICGDLMAQNENDSLIVHGEMANDAAEFIQLTSSVDRGINWSEVSVTKPELFTSAFVLPLSTDLSGDLWSASIAFVSFDPSISYSVFFLTSADHGISWHIASQPAFEQPELVESIQILDSATAYQICGYDLCFIDLSTNEVSTVPLDVVWNSPDIQMPNNTFARFIDPTTGWVIQNGSDASILFFTEDGGAPWQTISPSFTPSEPD